MTRQQFDANEKRDQLFSRAGWTCQVCGKALRSGQPQLAHRIPKKKHLLERYGAQVIHHELNLVPVCSLGCNAKVDIGGFPQEIEKLASRIQSELDKGKIKFTPAGRWESEEGLI